MNGRQAPRAQNHFIILLTVIVAFLLSVMPLPDRLALFRPEWVYLVVFFWVIAIPQHIGITVAWVVGLLLDVLDGTLLGMQALTLSITAYLALVLHQRLKLYPLLQQSLVVFVILGLHLLINHWIQGLVGVVSSGYLYLVPALVSAVIWPGVFVILKALQIHFRVQ